MSQAIQNSALTCEVSLCILSELLSAKNRASFNNFVRTLIIYAKFAHKTFNILFIDDVQS